MLDRAVELADTVLFPAAIDVDRVGSVPATHWEALADAGLYGIAAPAVLGGAELEFGELVAVLEVVASGCLATAFTWVQHHGAVASLVGSTNVALRDELLPGLVTGRTRGGVAFAVAVPVPPPMRAERVDGGRSSDDAPFVSRVTRADFMANQNLGSRLNGTRPIGLVRRCAALLARSAIFTLVAASRPELKHASTEDFHSGDLSFTATIALSGQSDPEVARRNFSRSGSSWSTFATPGTLSSGTTLYCQP